MDTGIVTEVKEINRDKGPGYITYSSPDYDLDTAILRFEARYGFYPEEVEVFKGYLMVGPVPEQDMADYLGVE